MPNTLRQSNIFQTMLECIYSPHFPPSAQVYLFIFLNQSLHAGRVIYITQHYRRTSPSLDQSNMVRTPTTMPTIVDLITLEKTSSALIELSAALNPAFTSRLFLSQEQSLSGTELSKFVVGSDSGSSSLSQTWTALPSSAKCSAEETRPRSYSDSDRSWTSLSTIHPGWNEPPRPTSAFPLSPSATASFSLDDPQSKLEFRPAIPPKPVTQVVLETPLVGQRTPSITDHVVKYCAKFIDCCFGLYDEPQELRPTIFLNTSYDEDTGY